MCGYIILENAYFSTTPFLIVFNSKPLGCKHSPTYLKVYERSIKPTSDLYRIKQLHPTV